MHALQRCGIPGDIMTSALIWCNVANTIIGEHCAGNTSLRLTHKIYDNQSHGNCPFGSNKISLLAEKCHGIALFRAKVFHSWGPIW